MTLLNSEQQAVVNYDGELTLEAISVLDTYSKTCCQKSATARKLKKSLQQVNKYLKQPFVRDIFKLKLLQKGITPEKIAQTILEGLDAEHTVSVYDDDAEHGERARVTEPDWQARVKFTQLAAEIFEVLKYQVKADVSIDLLQMLNPEFRSKTDDDIKREVIELGGKILLARQGIKATAKD